MFLLEIKTFSSKQKVADNFTKFIVLLLTGLTIHSLLSRNYHGTTTHSEGPAKKSQIDHVAPIIMAGFSAAHMLSMKFFSFFVTNLGNC